MITNFYLESRQIRMYINMPEGRKRYRLDEFVDKKKWDSKKQRPKNNPSLKEYLDKLEQLNEQYKRELRLDGRFNWAYMKERIDSFMGSANSYTLSSWFDEFTRRKADNPDLSRDYINGTLKMVRNAITDFQDQPLGAIDKKWYESFVNFHKRKKASSTVSQISAILKESLNLAYSEGHMIYDPGRIKTKIRVHQKIKVRLSLQELDLIRSKKLVGYLDYIRQEFLLNCLTGARYDDNYKLDTSYIRGKELVFQLDKSRTGAAVYIPVTDEMNELLTTLPCLRSQYYLKTHYQKYQDHIKTMARECEVNTKMTFQEIIDNTPQKVTFEKWEKITSHTARRTFGGIRADLGFTLRQIQELYGHSKMSTTERYLSAVL